jgi:predicted glutamine amidotransferase
MNHPSTASLSDRALFLKLADVTADNNDGFGFAFYNARLVEFAISVCRWRDEQWINANQSFAEAHPRNPNATCRCEHWQSCIDCHPTAHQEKTE